MTDPEYAAVLETLYTQYYDDLVLHCLSVVHYAPEMRAYVEECVQDTFLKAVARYARLKNHPDLRGWLFVTCYNHMRNTRHIFYNREKKHAYSIDANPSMEIADLADAFLKMDDEDTYSDRMECIYTLLTETEKQVFDDYFIHHSSFEDIAKHTGRSKRAVESVLYRIRKRLGKNLPLPLIIFFLIGAFFPILNNWIRRGR